MRMIKAIVVDDEDKARQVLCKQLAMYCKNVEVVASCNSVDSAMESIRAHSPDLVFLDINMPGKDGFELLKAHPDAMFKTIFTTAFDKYAVQAIKFSALDYLLKPIDSSDLVHAVAKIGEEPREPVDKRAQQLKMLLQYLQEPEAKIERIILPTNSGFVIESLSDVTRIEADSNYSIFHFTGNRQLVVCRTLKHYEEALASAGFFRVHQSNMINLKHVAKYTKGDNSSIIMMDGATVNIARNKKAEFLKVFFDKMMS